MNEYMRKLKLKALALRADAAWNGAEHTGRYRGTTQNA